MKMSIVAMLLAGAAAPAWTQTPATPPAVTPAKPDAEAVAAAMKFLDAQHFEQQLLDSTEMFTEAFMAAAIQRQMEQKPDEPAPEAFLKDLRGVVRDHSVSAMKSNMADLKRQTAEIYARHLTTAELNRIAELSADPAMQKLQEQEKLIQPQLVMMGMQLMKKYEPALKAKVDAVIEKHLNELGGGSSES